MSIRLLTALLALAAVFLFEIGSSNPVVGLLAQENGSGHDQLTQGDRVRLPPLPPRLAGAYHCATGAPLEPRDAVVSVDPSALPLGDYRHTIDPHWLMSPGSVFSHSHWTRTAARYLAAADHTMPALKSTSCS